MNSASIVIVPGVGDSGADHWQSWLQSRSPHAVRVVQEDWNMPVRDEWTAALDRVVASAGDRPVLVGHSAGSVTIVH